MPAMIVDEGEVDRFFQVVVEEAAMDHLDVLAHVTVHIILMVVKNLRIYYLPYDLVQIMGARESFQWVLRLNGVHP